MEGTGPPTMLLEVLQALRTWDARALKSKCLGGGEGATAPTSRFLTSS